MIPRWARGAGGRGLALLVLTALAALSGAMPVTAEAPPVASLSWVRTGGPLGGLGYDVRMRPDDPDLMFVTDAWAGVFSSTDGGRTWRSTSTGIETRAGETGDGVPVFCLTVDPHDPRIVWSGTQNERGIFKSTDGGQTWAQMDSGVVETSGITFRGITVDPRSSDTVYAAAELSSWVWAGQDRPGREFDMTGGVVYRTTDGGQSWEAIWRGDNLARYVLIDPRNPQVIYVSTGIFDREAANSDPAARIPGGEGVVKSTDGGATWRNVNGGLANLYVGSLVMHNGDPDLLLAGTGNNQYFERAGVYLSSDGGETWRQTLTGDIINSVEFAAADTNVAYAASSNAVFRSADRGETWDRVAGDNGSWGAPGVRAGFPIDLQVDPRDSDRLFANNYGGGNFLSTDGGRTWTVASTGYTGAQVRDIAIDLSAPARVFAAARSGMFASADGGGEWAGLGYGQSAVLEWNAIAVEPSDPMHLLAANNWQSAIVESHNGGLSWRVAAGEPGASMGWRVIEFAPSDPRTVYAGTGAWFSAGTFDDSLSAAGLSVSHDGGASWSRLGTGEERQAQIAAIAIDAADSQVLHAASPTQGVLHSTDGGQRWNALNEGLPGSPQALSVALHPGDAGVVFVGLGRAGLYRSANGGASWQWSGNGLNPEASISDIVFDPADPGVLYVADRFGGVFRSTDDATTWSVLNSGLTSRAVNALAISADGAHLYAATEGGGTFRLDVSGAPPEPTAVAVTTDLKPGFNVVTFTGATGTDVGVLAGQIGSGLDSIWRFSAATQQWEGYDPDLPAWVNNISTLVSREVLLIKSRSGVTLRQVDTQPAGVSKVRSVTLYGGANLVSYTGAGGDVAALTAGIVGLQSVFIHDADTQRWLSFIPGAPAVVNQFSTLSRFDGVYLVVAGPTSWSFAE